MSNYLCVREVADRLRVSTMTIHRLIRDGQLSVVRVGRSIRIEEAEYDRYIAGCTQRREDSVMVP